ncbi:uncharacterized protein LOC141628409 [Silene latifolia]|uniref:uncharacterized protein LOC141628409 n=1 Tax=Silene latifolia TaxID=37657 RepID=UPI003D784226
MTTAEALKQINDTLVAMMERLTAVEAKIAVEAPIPPPPETEFEKRFRLIEEQLKLSRGENVHYENARGYMPVQDKLPTNFVLSDIPKFKGTEDPLQHIRSYKEYLALKGTTVCTLEVMTQKDKEGFTEFLNRWRAESVKLAKRPEETEMVDKFIKNLRPVYRDAIKYQHFGSFKDLIRVGRKIEDDVRSAKAEKPKGYQGASSFKAKTSSSANHIQAIGLLGGAPKGSQRHGPRAFTDIGCTYAYALQRLSAQEKLNPIGPTLDPPADRQGKWYKPNAYCAYHQGKGHDTENCYRLKHEIQDMIENGSLPIPTVRPNNLNNPFGDHANAKIRRRQYDVSHLIQPICRLTGFFVGKVYVSRLSEYIPQAKNEVQIGDFTIDCTPYILRSENEINGVWADDEDDIYLSHQSPSKTPTKEATSVRALGEGSTSEASLIKQLQRTKADVSIWELMLSSFEHRQALLQALMNMTVSMHTTPDDVVSFVAPNQPRLTNAVTFSDEDLPSFGPQHCLAMYITVECRHKRLPMTLVDDGSAVNVLPLRTAFILGLEKSDFAPTTQTVRAFDGTVRRVSGLVTLSVNVGKVERKVNFQVIDVASYFNILLGRPWIHTAGAVSSTLHRKIKIPLKGEVVTIDATPIIVTGGDVTSEVQTDNTALESCGFEVVNAIESTFEAPNMDLYMGSRVCKTIFKTGKYFGYSMYPRRENPFQLKSPVPKGTRYGLGYEPTEEDSLRKRFSIEDRDIKMGPYLLTLNGHFVKAGEEILSLDFPKPLFNSKANKLVPGIEVFRDFFYIPEDIMAVATIKKEFVPIEDGKAMSLLFGEEKKPEIPNEVLVNMIVRSDRFDPSTFITNVDPQRNTSGWRKTMKWTDNKGSLFKMTIGEGQMFKPDDDSESESDISPKAKSRVLGVEDTPSQNEVEDRQVEEEEEEVEPPPQLVKGLEEYDQRSSVIEDTKVVNVGTTLEPQELKIGTTLDPAERKGFVELLNEFKDVFAWSYKDMPGIDREIAEHKIPIKTGSNQDKRSHVECVPSGL